MQFLSLRRPAGQGVENDGSKLVARFSELCLGSPYRLGNLWPVNCNFLLSGSPPPFRPPPAFRGPPPFRSFLPPVYDTLQGQKVPEESQISASPEGPKRHQTLWSVPECSTTKQDERGRVENWACVNFSCVRFEETNKFVFELRDTCVAIGMEFDNLDPAVNLHISNPVHSVMESTFSYLHGLIEDEAVKRHMGLLIVILPDFRSFDAEVEERCKNLAVSYQTYLPEHAMTSSNEYLNGEAREINRKILFCNVLFNALMNLEECGQSTEEMGDDCISMEPRVKIRKDGDSKEFCSPHEELKDGATSEPSDEDMGELGDSRDVLDEEMGEYGDSLIGNDPEDDDKYSGSEILSDFEDECSFFVTDDSEESYSDEEMREDDGTEGAENCIMSAGSADIPPPFTAFLCPDECVSLLKAGWGTKVPYKKPSSISWDDYSKLFDTNGYYKLIRGKPEEDKSLVSAAEETFVEHMVDKNSNTTVGHVANENFLGYGKQPWLMGVRSTKRDYSLYGKVKIRRGIVVDWACVNFSQLDDRQLYRFYCKLSVVCHSIRMSFNSAPMETFNVKAADTDIANTFSNVFENISQQFASLGMEGETIGLMLIILPEARELDAKIKGVCNNLGVLYHCVFPSDISLRDDASMKKLACQIKSKVVERDTFIPFVSEGQTFIFGADASCDNVACVVAPMNWQEFRYYEALVGPNNGAKIQDLFNEKGGMIGDLLLPFRTKIERDCRIIFFRHGVIEEHIDNICHQEVHAIKLACGQLEIGCKPSVTFVVVGGNEEESSNDGKHDFVCHHGFVKGTSPARYRVVLDENNLTFAEVESIIIKLCLLRDHVAYPEISMVAPAYAASLETSQENLAALTKTATPSSSGLC